MQETAAYVQTINAHTKRFAKHEKDAQERAKALQRSLARKLDKNHRKILHELVGCVPFACGEERVEALTADKTAATDLHSINVLGQAHCMLRPAMATTAASVLLRAEQALTMPMQTVRLRCMKPCAADRLHVRVLLSEGGANFASATVLEICLSMTLFEASVQRL